MIEGSLTKQHWNSFSPFLGPCLIHCKDRIREKTGKKGENLFRDTYAPSFKEVEGAYWFGVVLACVHPSMCLFITLFEACHILWTVHARVLKFHIWVPHGKIADTHLFSYPSYLTFWSYALLKKSEWNLIHAISYELCMPGFWNFMYGFLMDK